MKIAILILCGMLTLLMTRIVFLLRTHDRLSIQSMNLEKRIVAQHRDILTTRQEVNIWRGEMLRIVDACRADFSQRLDVADKQCRAIEHMRNALPIPDAPFLPLSGEVSETSLTPVPSIS